MAKGTQKLVLTVILLVLINSTFSFAQNFNVNGQFTGKNLDKSFINVINITQYITTISQLDGNFEIPAAVGDSILVSSIQYQDVKFIVKAVFKTEKIEIPLQLKINELDDVDIYSLGLTGDLETDVENIQTQNDLVMNLGSFDISNTYDPEVTIQSEFTLKNDAFNKTQPNIPTNFDFIMMGKMLKGLLAKKKKKKQKSLDYEVEDIPFSIKNVDALSYYLNIEKEQVEGFMAFAYENGLNEKLKTQPSELDLIQFLINLSFEYAEQNETHNK